MNGLYVNKITVLFFYSEGSSLNEIKDVEKQVKKWIPTIDFLTINVDNNPKVSRSFHVNSTPLLLVLQNGKELWRQTNGFTDNELCSQLNMMNTYK